MVYYWCSKIKDKLGDTMTITEKLVKDKLKKCGEVNNVRQDVEFGNNTLHVTFELNKNDNEMLIDTFVELKGTLEDMETDDVEYDLQWRQNWHGEDVIVLVTYK